MVSPYCFVNKLTTFSIIITTPTLSAFQVIVSPVPFVKFGRKKLGVTPGWCHVGRSTAPAPPSDATGLKSWLRQRLEPYDRAVRDAEKRRLCVGINGR